MKKLTYILLGIVSALSLRAQTINGVSSQNISVPSSSITGTATKYCDSFPGANFSIKVNACIAAVIASGGGTADAQALGGTQSQGTQEIDVGSSSFTGRVRLLLPQNGVWPFGLTGGTSCGIKQFSNSEVIGPAQGESAGQFYLQTVGGTNMDSLYCTNAGSGFSNFIYARGVAARNDGGGTFTNGIIDIRNVGDSSTFEYMIGVNNSGDALHLDSACCGMEIKHGYFVSSLQGSNYAAGGIPCTIGGVSSISTGVKIEDTTCNAPKSGNPNIVMQGTLNGFTGINLYGEGNAPADTTTPMIRIGANVLGATFVGGAMAGCAVPSDCSGTYPNKYVFENSSYWNWMVTGMNMNGNTGAIKDLSSGPVIAGTAFAVIPTYMGGHQSTYIYQLAMQAGMTSYNGDTLTGNGIASVVGSLNQVALSANLSNSTLKVPSADGMYAAECYVVLTRAATTSSQLPNCVLTYNDADTNVVQSYYITQSSTANTVGTTNLTANDSLFGPPFYAKSGTNIIVSTQNYASSGATSMQYAIHVKLTKSGS